MDAAPVIRCQFMELDTYKFSEGAVQPKNLKW